MSSENELEEIDYKLPILGRSKWIIGILAVLFISIFLYFPISYKVKSLIKSNISKIPGCPLQYNNITTELFFPKLVVEGLSIPMRCFNQNGQPIKLEKVFLFFRGFSFSPFGPHFKLETQLNKNPISAYITAGIGGIALNIRENTLELDKILKPFPDVKFSGKVEVDALVRINSGELSDLKLNIRSKNFMLPAQSIKGFSLSNMNINDLLIQTQMTGNKLNIKNIIMGDTDSPIRAKFNGDIKMHKKNIKMSTLNVKGEVAFSQTFLEKYMIIGMFMKKYDKKDEFYQLKIGGTIGRPNPTSAR
jgi:type II secretion system protein N